MGCAKVTPRYNTPPMDVKASDIPFVARKRELEKLERLLGRALQSQMQVAMSPATRESANRP